MSELDTKKHPTEEPLPLLSLNTKNSVRERGTKDQTNPAEQEELWKRSLAFFEHMKASSNA
ncbi:MAG: hypothetical protein IJ165_15495 [Proteobacteria bacterium]|nr:hypothetical protein [Pseudomonadota bacterium]